MFNLLFIIQFILYQILIWNPENCYKDNILNIFDIDNLQLQYNIDNQEQFDLECQDNNSEMCFICYDQLPINNQIKSCYNTKCDALYHMSCICEVKCYFLNILATITKLNTLTNIYLKG